MNRRSLITGALTMIGGLAAKKLGIKPSYVVKTDGPPDSFRFKWKKLPTNIKLSDDFSGPSGGCPFPGEDGERFFAYEQWKKENA